VLLWRQTRLSLFTASAIPLAIFTEAILPEAQRKLVEDGCDTGEKALKSEKCLFSLRFNYRAEDVDEDILSGYQRRIVIKLDLLELVPMANSRKRR
jgi:hypothetical protein